MIRTTQSWTIFLLSLITFALLLTSNMASASVTMLGNRVIYPAESKEKTLQFNNDDDTPALVQLWLDNNDKESSPETANAPFLASPQIFRMNPHSGQMVRLVFTGNALAADRESIFYLNFLQVPAVKQSDNNKNKLMLVVTNRLKVLYRPEGLAGDANHLIEQMTIKREGKTLLVNNPTPYFANVSHAAIVTGSKRINIPKADMIPPFSQANWQINSGFSAGALKISLGVINDYGVEVSRVLTL
ncbi:MAG: molecular chaperone [Enterobacteriaceae bacterium]|jgi:fimbrial chaperone protein|nr:molecular chaperone [Enterobacteriaceae bacterium]